MRKIMGYGPFKTMAEAGEVYAKDVVNGQSYRSRFGFLVEVEGGKVYKIRPDGTRYRLQPNPFSIFKKGPS